MLEVKHVKLLSVTLNIYTNFEAFKIVPLGTELLEFKRFVANFKHPRTRAF